MLARRGVAGSLIVLCLSALLVVTAIEGPSPLAAPGTLVAILWLVATGGLCLLMENAIRMHSLRGANMQTPRASSIDDLVGMLWDTLVLARSPRSDKGIVPVDVPALLADAARKYPKLSVTFAGTPRSLFAEADPRALGHAFDILIDNAYANGRRVALKCDSGTSIVVVHIDDDGPGIPRDLRQRIFERQYYMSTPPSQRPGCSVALVIAHQNALASGGDLSVGPSPLGGARFTLRLPLVSAQARDNTADAAAVEAA